MLRTAGMHEILGDASTARPHVLASLNRAAVVVYFECTDLDATYTRLSDRGVAFYAAPADQTWLWREAYLKDPDGNVLCLFQAGENRRCPPWRVASE